MSSMLTNWRIAVKLLQVMPCFVLDLTVIRSCFASWTLGAMDGRIRDSSGCRSLGLSDLARHTTFGRSVHMLDLYLETMTLFNEVWRASLNLNVVIVINRMQRVASNEQAYMIEWLLARSTLGLCICRLAQHQDCLLYTLWRVNHVSFRHTILLQKIIIDESCIKKWSKNKHN